MLSAHRFVREGQPQINYVFTGVVERIGPDGAHLQIVFVPLNDPRDALVRDAAGQAGELVGRDGRRRAWSARSHHPRQFSTRHGLQRRPRAAAKRAARRGSHRGTLQVPRGQATCCWQALWTPVEGATPHGDGPLAKAHRSLECRVNACVACTGWKKNTMRVSFVGKSSVAVVVLVVALRCLGLVRAPPRARRRARAQGKSVGTRSAGTDYPARVSRLSERRVRRRRHALVLREQDPSATRRQGAREHASHWTRDIFTSKDFYVDRDLWMDKRYDRCNSPTRARLDWATTRAVLGGSENSNPATAAWDTAIATTLARRSSAPYPFKTARALRSAARRDEGARRSRTCTPRRQHPDWNGSLHQKSEPRVRTRAAWGWTRQCSPGGILRSHPQWVVGLGDPDADGPLTGSLRSIRSGSCRTTTRSTATPRSSH